VQLVDSTQQETRNASIVGAVYHGAYSSYKIDRGFFIEVVLIQPAENVIHMLEVQIWVNCENIHVTKQTEHRRSCQLHTNSTN